MCLKMANDQRLLTLILIGALLLQTCSTNMASNESLSDYMWRNTEAERIRVMNSTFVKAIRAGMLDPTEFGIFMLQDAVYLNASAEAFKIAASRSTDNDITNITEEWYENYQRYAEELSELWHINDISTVKLGTAMSGYISYERSVAETMDPVFFLLANIPCNKLWPWIGEQLNFSEAGIYQTWVEDNFGPYKAYEILEDIVNEKHSNGLIDREEAMDIYRTAMGHEAAFFETSAEKNRDPTETTKMTPCAATSISLDLSFILISLGWLVCQLLGN